MAFYERRRLGLGRDFEQVAQYAVRAIQANPEHSALQKNGTRRFIMGRFPFVIHYVDLPDTIWVLAFAHTSRKPGYWQRRL